jgi:hypothetical protein
MNEFTLASYDLQPLGGASLAGRKNIELSRAQKFSQRIAGGENPHSMGIWEALTNIPKCGGLKSRRARSIAQAALRRSGWVFVISLAYREPDENGDAREIPSQWGLVRKDQAKAWDAVGISLDAAAAKVGGWRAYWAA